MGFTDRLSRRERQHIGGGVLAPPGAVQLAHLVIIGEDQRHFASAASGAAKVAAKAASAARDSVVAAHLDAVPEI